jgi:predicted RNase H-like nuclease (RuvC/YqgF family)
MSEEQVIQETPQLVEQQPALERTAKIEHDFASLRKAKEEAERRAQNAELLLAQQNNPQSTSDDEDFTIDNEDYVQAKHVKSNNKNIKKKLTATEQRIADLEQKLSFFEAKVDTDSLKDFQDVVTDSAIEKLARQYPSDYRSMMMNPNLRERSRTAYNMIKNYGVSSSDFKDIDKKIAENKQKPQLASLVSPQQPASTLARFTDDGRRIITEADRDAILKEHERKKMMW